LTEITLRTVFSLSPCFLLLFSAGVFSQSASYPPSPLIAGISFDMSTLEQRAPGSDDWPVTWAADGNQYTSWGDGGGFGGTNSDGRVSLGFARVAGPGNDYTTVNTWGGKGKPPPPFGGKCYGMLALGDTLYMWRGGSASDETIYEFQELYISTDKSLSWTETGVRFTEDDFPGSRGFFAPTFLQFGRGYKDTRDKYVYIYAPEIKSLEWNVQHPGEIALIRVPREDLADKSEYEYFAGLDDKGKAGWSSNIAERAPVFSDPNGVMRTSVAYNKGLGRYLLITQQVDRFRDKNGHIGIYDAPEPWGPWNTVLFANAFDIGLVTHTKTVFFNFSNKWTAEDGRDFVLVYTNEDNWATVEGRFILR